ncbi:hypothetical protein IWQ57_004046 [Coemansia nantahalensis]|uniref:Uncharacterized protein n=2 Tax=Coemansia TaxID=4863 RepID=A0ACC1LG43_9FUNG|nr:hypothetical protein IWQ57_004046 [Coemansia nantahalensis]KAJ2807806.1 hypothetical protein H4R21_000334 [Coemansia helicoidea]
MKVVAFIIAAAAAVAAQDIAADGGNTVSTGASAINHKNENSGTQVSNSLLDSGNKGGNSMNNLNGNSFVDSTSNVGLSDNNIVNPSQTTVSGNTGSTANGHGNHIAGEDRRRMRRRDIELRIRRGQYF